MGTRLIGDLCFNVPDMPIYGEITQTSLANLMNFIKPYLNESTFIIDIGSGSGYALSYLARGIDPLPCRLFGAEISSTRVELSRQILPKILPKNVTSWTIECLDISSCLVLSYPFEVCYSFDKVFPKKIMKKIQNLQSKCKSLRFVITTQIDIYKNKNWTLIGKHTCLCRGSNASFMFYVLRKKNKEPKKNFINV